MPWEMDPTACPSFARELAAEIESNICPICFELMKSPEHTPILLSPCGHTFCAQCLSVHMTTNGKKLCPYCRQLVACAALNLSLQSLISRFLSLQNSKEFQTAQKDHGKRDFSERLVATETRLHVLKGELAETLTRKKKLEDELCKTEIYQMELENRQLDAKERLGRVREANPSSI